jgi:hypothetical protein
LLLRVAAVGAELMAAIPQAGAQVDYFKALFLWLLALLLQ